MRRMYDRKEIKDIAAQAGGSKLYLHTLYCTGDSNNKYRIIAYSSKQEQFTFDYIKAHPTCLNGTISIVTDGNGSADFDRVISHINAEGNPTNCFEIYSYGITPQVSILTFVSDEVVEL